MAAAKISILLPFHNAAATLPETLDSIQAQQFDQFELLAVNDHSSDGSVELVAERARGDQRIRLLHAGHRGIVAALNRGLAEACSGLIARMDADDLMSPQRLQRQYRRMQQVDELVLLGSQARLFPEQAIQAGYREYMRWQNGCNSYRQIAAEIYLESPFAHPTVLFRRRPVVALGGYRHGPFPEDYELWLRMFQAGHRMEKLPEVLLDWRESTGRTSRVDPRCSREAFDRLRGYYLAREPRLLQARDNFVIWGAGRKTRLRCRHLLAQGFTPRAWIDIDPRKIGNRLRGVPVVAPDWLRRADPPLVLVYVANHGARELIAADLEAMGYRAGEGYLLIG